MTRKLLILDFDDTLLPTTWMAETPVAEALTWSAPFVELLLPLLTQAVERISVYIVTNAEDGWITKVTSAFCPELQAVLAQCHHTSARSSFGHLSENPVQWKVEAFRALLHQERLQYEGVTWQMVAISDSTWDHWALRTALAEHSGAVSLHTVDFVFRPTPSKLLEQWTLLADQWEQMLGG